jgi:glycosyltransferase involved in cell wall biosynthesis
MSRLSTVPIKEVPAMRLHRRAKAAVRQRLRGRVVLDVMLRLPAGRGPAWWRRFADRARVAVADELLLQAGDFEGAQEAVRPLLDSSRVQSRAWGIVATAREKQGDPHGALDAARRATGTEQVRVAELLLHRRAAALAGEDAEADAVLRRLSETPPQTVKDFEVTVAAIADASPDLLAEYERSLSGWGVPFDPERFREVEAELQLVALYESDRQAALRDFQRIEAERVRFGRVIVRALARCSAWDDLASFAKERFLDRGDGRPPAGDINDPAVDPEAVAWHHLPTAQVRNAAYKAFGAGHISAAVTLSTLVLAERPEDPVAQQILLNGSDQLAVVAAGWRPSAAEPTPYSSRPTAVLSVLSQSAPIQSGGYATRTHGLLVGLARKGWDIRAITRLGFPYDRWKASDPRVVAEMDVVDGIPYHRLLEEGVREYPQYPLSSYIQRFSDRLVKHATAHQAALIHSASFFVTGLPSADAARRLGLPLIYEMRGLEDLMKVSKDPSFVGTERYQFLTMLEREVCLQAERVFVITDALRREMSARGVPDDRMLVVPNGVHSDRFVPQERDRDLEAQLGVAERTVIGYAGGLVHYEGLEVLLDAVAMLKQRRADFHVIVVGDGQHERSIRALAAKLRLDDVVTFTGRVPHKQVKRYLSLFDIAPFPRQPLPVCELISPIKPFESMAMAKAVVVSSVAALTEIVQDGKTGLVFTKGEPADLARSLERLLDSRDLRESLGREAREWVIAERDWKKIVPTVDEAYRAVLDSAGVRAVRR